MKQALTEALDVPIAKQMKGLRMPCEHSRYEDCGALLFTYGTKRVAARCPGGRPPTDEELIEKVSRVSHLLKRPDL